MVLSSCRFQYLNENLGSKLGPWGERRDLRLRALKPAGVCQFLLPKVQQPAMPSKFQSELEQKEGDNAWKLTEETEPRKVMSEAFSHFEHNSDLHSNEHCNTLATD